MRSTVIHVYIIELGKRWQSVGIFLSFRQQSLPLNNYNVKYWISHAQHTSTATEKGHQMAFKLLSTTEHSIIVPQIEMTVAILWAHKPILAIAWPFSGVGFHLVSWWRAFYGPPVLGVWTSKTLIARWMEHTCSQGNGTLSGLSGTLTHDTSWGSGTPPRLWARTRC